MTATDGDDDLPTGTAVRPYDPTTDEAGLWACKAAFERGLGEGTGDEAKAARYEAKLTDDYRAGYLSWVRRCVDEEPGSVRVAVSGGAGADADARAHLVGYAFVLPASLAYVWDAAVLNELFVRPAARGTGVADALLDAALAQARGQALPIDRLVLDVDPANGRARAFYDRHGFERWGEMIAREL